MSVVFPIERIFAHFDGNSCSNCSCGGGVCPSARAAINNSIASINCATGANRTRKEGIAATFVVLPLAVPPSSWQSK
jgi:hypothetical protein